jgi:type I restriction enzyme S subunit
MTWPIAPLRELTTKIGSGATPRGGRDSYKSDGIPLIRSMNVHDGIFLTKGMAYLDLEQAKSLDNVELETGDVLLNITGASVARVCRLPEQFKGGRVNQHVAIIRTKNTLLHPHFLEHFLICPDTKAKLLSIAASGATREAITKSAIEELCVPVPPLSEQKRIAAILDQADELCSLSKRALDRLNQLGQSIFYEMFGDPAINPSGWEHTILGSLVLEGDRINYGVVQPGENLESGIPLVRVADLISPLIDRTSLKKIADDIEAGYTRSRLRGDEILVGCVGSIGAINLAHSGLKGVNIARAVGRVPIDPKKASRIFVAEQLRTQHVQNYFRSEVRVVAQPTLNIKQLIETPLFVPPKQMQDEFAERLSAVGSILRSQAAAATQASKLFASLQHHAFRGEL